MFRKQISENRFQKADFRWQISDGRIQETEFRKQISESRFQKVDFRWQKALFLRHKERTATKVDVSIATD